MPKLLIFGGLPACGKSTISMGVARQLGAMHLRVDTIEQTLRELGMGDIGGEGYELAYKIAADNLALGATVVADSVNPISLTRDAWRSVGERANVDVLEIEVVCSDPREHQTRVETREVNIQGLVLPTWRDVLAREYHPWGRKRLVLDTAGETPEQSLKQALLQISRYRNSAV